MTGGIPPPSGKTHREQFSLQIANYKTSLQCSLLCTYADDPCYNKSKGERECLPLKHLCPSCWSPLLCCHLLMAVWKFRAVPNTKQAGWVSLSWQWVLGYTQTITTKFSTSHLAFPFPRYTQLKVQLCCRCNIMNTVFKNIPYHTS